LRRRAQQNLSASLRDDDKRGGVPDERQVCLDRDEGVVRWWWEFDVDGMAGLDRAGVEDDGHDSGAWGFAAEGVEVEGGGHEAGLEAVHLDAGGAEAGEFDDGGGAEVEAGGDGEVDEVDGGGEDVFSEVAGVEVEAVAVEVLQELDGEEVDLGEVGGGGFAAAEVAVADGGAAVGVVLDAELGEEVDLGLGLLGEGVGGAQVDGEDLGYGHYGQVLEVRVTGGS